MSRKLSYLILLGFVVLMSINVSLPSVSAQTNTQSSSSVGTTNDPFSQTVGLPQAVLRDGEVTVSPARHIFSDLIGGTASAYKYFSIVNQGTSTLTILNIDLIGADASQYLLSPSNPLPPFTIPSGQTRTIGVAFNPTSINPTAVKVAQLEVTSNSATNPIITSRMRGLALKGNGGSFEPSLSRILETFEIPVNVGDDDPATTTINSNPALASGAAALGDEVLAQSFTLANSGSPATVEVLATFANDFNPVTYTGYYRTGQPGNRYQVFTVNQGSSQTLLPATSGNLYFTPATSPFGFYSVWPTFGFRSVFSEDIFNTYDPNPARRHKTRIYPMKNTDGSIEPNAYIVTYEELGSASQTVWDYNDVVYIVRNITPVATTSGALIDFENLDWQKMNSLNIPGTYWFNTWLAFNTMGTIPNNGNWSNLRVHDEVTLRIDNRSTTAPLNISAMTISTNKYYLINPPTFPLTIPPTSFYDQVVKFDEDPAICAPNCSKGSRKATLTIASDAANEPVSVINLGGIYMPQPEGSNEVNVSVIADALGLKSNTQPIPQGQWLPAGEEVMSKYWQRLDPNQPIYTRQVDAFHGCCSATTGITLDFITGEDVKFAPAHHPDYGQSVNPLNWNYPGPPVNNFKFTELTVSDRSDPFEMVIAGITACDAPCGNMHGVRWWPARDNTGLIVPGLYFVSMDYVNGGVGG
ncbi:MAG TPA: choice-of-anchor D domain-containing protein, partial [Phototrophicaceae bacterium]|nr:choice-of-anchor D domain-containing protein [Phototrophicaceae bacterium]